jgi:ABC-type glycerol-3-phosphate transport system substrate-binding protein
MRKRAWAGLAAALIGAASFGALTAPAAAAASAAVVGGPVGKPKPVCVWIWTEGPPECRKLE